MAAAAAPTSVTSDAIVIREYHSAAQPRDWLKDLPVRTLAADGCDDGKVTHLNLSDAMRLPWAASSPNLLAGFVKLTPGEPLCTSAVSTSQAFFVVRGSGRTTASWGSADGADPGPHEVSWSAGDLFTLPAAAECEHTASEAQSLPPVRVAADTAAPDKAEGQAVLYWVHDAPLLSYLGVTPSRCRFAPALYPGARLVAEVERVRGEAEAEAAAGGGGGGHRNRLGVLLSVAPSSSSSEWAERTKTLTPTLWSLLNVIPAGVVQPPHRHNSVALDLAVDAPAGGGVYTLMSPHRRADGSLVDPIRVEWQTGAAFVTPPNWWHSHHNETDQDAWVLPVQDAGLHTHMQTLNIEFSSK